MVEVRKGLSSSEPLPILELVVELDKIPALDVDLITSVVAFDGGVPINPDMNPGPETVAGISMSPNSMATTRVIEGRVFAAACVHRNATWVILQSSCSSYSFRFGSKRLSKSSSPFKFQACTHLTCIR